jgi:N-acetylmuramic acid 6-phosphate etherase
METERPSPRYSKIDVWEPSDILEAMTEGQFAAVAAVRASRHAIERAALAMVRKLNRRGRLIYVGAGTSGRLAVQDGAELPPTFSWPRERLLLLIAGGKDALMHAVEGAEDEVAHGTELIHLHNVNEEDVVIAVAASGTTPFTVACLREAKRVGALTVGVANNPDTPLLLDADHPIYLDSGPEPIAGSTRMKAGTAQRTALILLSSLVMILLGRVYEGLMVDVQASNKKLIRRSERILSRLSHKSGSEISDALQRAGGSVKLAFLLLRGYEIRESEAALERAGGHLRRAIELVDRLPTGPLREPRHSGAD